MPSNILKKIAWPLEKSPKKQESSKKSAKKASTSKKPKEIEKEQTEKPTKKIQVNKPQEQPPKKVEEGIPKKAKEADPATEKTQAPVSGTKVHKKDYVYKDEYKQLNDPSYNPETDSPFNSGDPVPYFFLTDAFALVEEIKGKDSADKKKSVITN